MSKFTNTINVNLGTFAKKKIEKILIDIMRNDKYPFYYTEKVSKGCSPGKAAKYISVSNVKHYFDIVYSNYDTDAPILTDEQEVKKAIMNEIKQLYSNNIEYR